MGWKLQTNLSRKKKLFKKKHQKYLRKLSGIAFLLLRGAIFSAPPLMNLILLFTSITYVCIRGGRFSYFFWKIDM